ncbi:wax ester/triacylglycerol synthase family O-acyltransferase [Allohahella sp. A8]|uniref:wax ester/triacylglycerol synthase family O-acyltransferase n=1 Tax=Allohahella sp. A8 TaxID=3141461 RepID=UPI003A7F9B5A
MLSDFPIDPVSGNDAAWLRLDRPTNHMIITAMAITDALEPTRFTQLIEQRFAHLRRFCCRPVLHSGVYLWEQVDTVDLLKHIRHERLPPNAGKSELEHFVSALQSQPLSPDRPLWEFILLQGYGSQSVAIMRVHHCYADGLALISIFAALTDGDPDGPAGGSGDSEAGKVSHGGASSRRRRTAQSIKAGLEAVSHGVERVTQLNFRLSPESYHWLKAETLEGRGLQLLNSAAEFARLAALPRDPETAMSQPLGERKRALWSARLPLDDFKMVARQYGASVNDVLLSCVAGGLGKYLADRQSVEESLELRATVPVNLRPATQSPSLAAANDGSSQHQADDEDDLLGNQFGTIFIPLAVGLRNRVERLYKTKHDMRALKGSVQPMLSHIVIGAAGLLPTVLQQPLMDSFSNKTSLVLSNVPGSKEPRFIAGSAVNELMFWVPQGGETGLGISLLSYNGFVQIGLLCDPQCVDVPQQLMDSICSELDDYLAA